MQLINMRILIFGTVLLLLLSQSGSKALPRFSPPVKGVIELTGTFGELRPNHFHAGLDIRGAVGTPVYAIADGFVRRILVSNGGYGQALYLEHTNGYTSVYGHLDRFRDDITAFVRERQYAQESFPIEETLAADIFPVKEGDLVAFIGERGFVFGPHLHFEIRHTATERLLNPLNYGIQVADATPPTIRGIRLYELDERGRTLRGRDMTIKSAGTNRYTTVADTLWTENPTFALAIKAYDRQDARPNQNGIYGLEMWRDDSLRYAYRMDDYSSEQTRYLNAHIDYAEQRVRNSWHQRSYCMPGNTLDIYKTDAQAGRMTLPPGGVARIRFRITDHSGNEALLNLVVSRKKGAALLQSPVYTYYLPYDEESIIDNGAMKAHFAAGTFYEDIYLDYDQLPEQSSGAYSPVHRLHEAATPLHRYYDLHIRPQQDIPDNLRDKAFIAYCEDGRDPISYGGEWMKDGRLHSPVQTFGNFSIMVDQTPPTIRPERWTQDMRGQLGFSFRIGDDFPTVGKASALRHRAEVDGRWILMEYDARSGRIYHTFDGRIPGGKHSFELRVKDDRGNETVFKDTFISGG